MVRRNIKIFSCLLIFLLLIGVAGFFLSLWETHHRYKNQVKVVGTLANQVLKLQGKLDLQREKIARYDFMQYKTSALSNRFPEFAFILDAVYRKSLQYGFKPDLVMGVIQVESDYNPEAVSNKGAYGLMQVNLGVWKNYLNIDVTRIFDVEYNLDLGLKILKHYFTLTDGNLKMALHLYNNGYLYNNTSYTYKVDSAVNALGPHNIDWQSVGF